MHWLRTYKISIFLICGILLCQACEKVSVEGDESRLGYDYFPLSEGFVRTFDVFQVTYNFASQNDTARYEIKELITEEYENQEGGSSFVMHRLRRQHQEANWSLDSVYHLRRTEYQATQLSNNTNVVKLVFPVKEGKTWDSNILNSSPADSFRMIDVGRSFQLKDTLYNNTLTVLIRNIQDEIVRKDIRKEVYGQEIGLIYKIIQNLNYCAEPHCIGQGIITSGTFQEMTLKKYGSE